jgi:hypothetical protein
LAIVTRLIQIHAGIHKTGSTAIQRMLARLAPDLSAHGIATPGIGNKGSGHHILASFANDPDGCEKAWAKLAGRLERETSDRVLLSSEFFVNADPKALHTALSTLGPHEVRIQFYVRPHIALFTSLYLQRVKAGIALADPTDLAESYARSAEFDYAPVIEAYIDTFGADAVRVREFVPSAFEGGSLMADVWSFLDLPAPLLQQAEVLGRDVVNPTPTAEQAVVLIALARRARAAMGSAFQPRALRRSLAYLLTELRARLPGQATRYRLPMDLQSAIADHMDGPRAAFARHLDRQPSAAFCAEPVTASSPLAPIPFQPVRDALAAVADMAHERGWTSLSRVVTRFADSLRRIVAPNGGDLLDLRALSGKAMA